METYLLSSKLNELEREFVIKTSNDVKINSVRSVIYINGKETEETRAPHPVEYTPEEILALVKNKHEEKKQELEIMLHCFKNVIASGNPSEMFNLGTAFYYKQFYREARELFLSALAIRRNYHQALNYLGMTEMSLGNYNEALEFSEKAVELKPGFADYRYNLGQSYFYTGSYKKAVIEFETAIKTNLYYADAYLSLSLTYLKNAIEKNDMALFKDVLTNTIDYVKKAAIIDPFYNCEIHSEGLEAIKAMDLEVAYTLFSKLTAEKRIKRNAELAGYYMKYVYSHASVSEHTMAERIKYLKGEIEKYPTYADLHSDLGNSYLDSANLSLKNCTLSLKKALDINPNLDDINSLLAKVEEYHGLLQTLLEERNTGDR